jgi:two-component system OmpR family response regulator
MHVLIVEDDPNLRLLWAQVYADGGHETTESASLEEALGALRTGSFDLIILDLYLADGDGSDLARMIGEQGRNVPVLIVTGSAVHRNGELFGLSASIKAVLRKPVDIEDLIEVSEHLVMTDTSHLSERMREISLEIRS